MFRWAENLRIRVAMQVEFFQAGLEICGTTVIRRFLFDIQLTQVENHLYVFPFRKGYLRGKRGSFGDNKVFIPKSVTTGLMTTI